MNNPNVQLGQDMWALLAQTFQQVAADNFIFDNDAKGQLWAGFITSAAGAMIGDVGPSLTNAVLLTVAHACTDIAKDLPVSPTNPQKPSLKVVKP
jgi:hypothetical protein